jgi:hypothetical protein
MKGPFVPVYLNPQTGVRERTGPDIPNVFEAIQHAILDCWKMGCSVGMWDYPMGGIEEVGVVDMDSRHLVWQGPSDFYYDPARFPPIPLAPES